MKLENKLILEQRILINNCLAPFDSEFKYIDFGGYPFSLSLEICSGSALVVFKNA